MWSLEGWDEARFRAREHASLQGFFWQFVQDLGGVPRCVLRSAGRWKPTATSPKYCLVTLRVGGTSVISAFALPAPVCANVLHVLVCIT